MEENKLPQSIFGALISWVLTIIAWTVDHVGFICGFFAVLASIYSIKASRETVKLRQKQQRSVDAKSKARLHPDSESDTDL